MNTVVLYYSSIIHYPIVHWCLSIIHLGGEEECFRIVYADLQSQLNADNITGKLYSKEILTQCDKEDINNPILNCFNTKSDQTTRCCGKSNKSTIFTTLETIPLYKSIVEKAKEYNII